MIRPPAPGRAGPVAPTPGTVEVVVVDDQGDVAVDVGRWERLARHVLADTGIAGPAELQVAFVDEATMAELNGTHMGHDGPTDVLAFPLDAEDALAADGGLAANGAPSGHHPTPLPAGFDALPRLLGDVVICPVVAEANAPDHAGTLDDELALLTVHGILHLLGLDHITPEETEDMQARERELLHRHHTSPR